ncbi:MAG: polysaccharide biosynthesis protein [Daejeonella sp.]|nr:polysaccharide biosynthesis protein [Daejeonella sp.]
MKTLVQAVNSNLNYARLFEWSKLISITGGAQVLVQALGMISGILVIRLLPTHEYALYTLANTMLGTMTILADGGISTGVMAQGGKVWQDRVKFGSVLATGFDIRKKFAFVSLLISMPVLLVLLRHHGASWLVSVMIILSIIPAFFMVLSGTMLEIAPKICQDIAPLQKVQVGINFGRLAILSLTLFVFPWAFIAVLAAGLPQLWGNLQLRRITKKHVEWNIATDPEIRKEILDFVKRIFPTAIYYCVSGQITIWLISIFGSTDAVAKMGALGRLAMTISLFNVLFLTLVAPRFARLPSHKNILVKRFFQILGGLLIVSIFSVSFAWLFYSPVLWLLGNHYSGLRTELVLNILGSCLSLIAGVIFVLYTSRGWAIKPIISIPINLVTITLAAMLLDISSLKGILLLNIIVALVQVIMNVIYIQLQIKNVKG